MDVTSHAVAPGAAAASTGGDGLAADAPPAIEVTSLVKVYGQRRAVDGVSFVVRPGEILGLLGPNGAGKTTTVSVISTLIAPTSGDVHVFGASVRTDPMAVRTMLGVVPQDVALYPTMSAWENLLFWAGLYGLSGHRARQQAEWALHAVGLSDRGHELVERYSGGMRRRINLAIGLVHRPRVLLLDEPTVGVDPQSRIKILETIRNLNREGLSVLYTSHYMEEVEYLCHRVAVMDMGHIIAMGTQQDLRTMAGQRDVIRVRVQGRDNLSDLAARVRQLHGVDDVVAASQGLDVLTTSGRRLLPPLITWLHDQGVEVESVSVKEPDLESLFLHLTGRRLRD